LNEKLIKFTLPFPAANPPLPEQREPVADAPTKTRILVAEDDPVSRTLICARLQNWSYQVTAANDGIEAMAVMRRPDAPSLAVLDWSMPGMDGLEICRRIREGKRPAYLILLTARSAKENMIEGLRAGADDYLAKPFDSEELRARILVGLRVMTLQETLAARIRALEMAALEIQSLKLQIPL
jgi:DNA-binding response OmpR family regulator